MRRFASAAFLVAAFAAGVFAEPKPAAIGEKIGDIGELRDLRGNGRTLHSFKGRAAIVVAFIGAECPVANLYVPNLLELEKKYREKNVQFLAVYPNHGDDLDRVSVHGSDRDLPFPALKDAACKLADAIGATRVPTVAVLDNEYRLVYRGRIDDRYGVGAKREKATRHDLVEALDELLAGKKVSVPEAAADGCLIDRGDEKPAKNDVTYTKDISRIIQTRCQDCHRPGQTAPFALMSYGDAKRHAKMLKEVTHQRRMPPWHADSRFGHFANDRRMPESEIAMLASWVDNGMPEGDAKDLPKAIDWPSGWRHGKPDMIVSMPEEFEVPAEGVLNYKRWIVDPGFTEDKWVKITEGMPSAPPVVHHLVVYILKPGQTQPWSADGNIAILAAWAPGDLGTICPPETALRLPKGCKLQFEMHYTPNGTKTKDRSSIGIQFAEKPPKFEYFTNSFANESIVIPPYDPHYKAEQIWRMPNDVRILSFVPHMHWRGKDYKYEVIHTDGKRETVLSVPRWDFNWQNVYNLKEPLKLPKGSKLHAVAHWDNSLNNLYNPDPTQVVRFGLQTWDEMMVGWVAYVWERPEYAAEAAKVKFDDPNQLFDRFDRNGDEVITPNEIPAQMAPMMKLVKLPNPEKITREEFKTLFTQMRKQFAPKAKPPETKKP